MVRILKSMPMVVMNEGVKLSSLNRSRQHDLPTPESPIRRSLICRGSCVREEKLEVVDVVRESHSCGFGLPWRGQSVGESDSGWRYKGRRRQWEGKSESDGISADGEFTGQDSRG
jgi:hypothetical protein